jgi:hypothetical protein
VYSFKTPKKAENMKFIFTVGRRNRLTEMRKCKREKRKFVKRKEIGLFLSL